ncbi:MAG TPA: bifunctional helix-turn-helix transcriptional regulator/GNAT family N-acetyltransferase [Terriglobales bacterium]|jgi:DNA-binding MarR family transcriptional regulator/N-acetylglutamate synthase-like GNAT family acetyltransferase|nr:bifunctional helix-turn-helix transcriptional regulator/GNAT family N-acetyltransferase [Terriglobales bacterium]
MSSRIARIARLRSFVRNWGLDPGYLSRLLRGFVSRKLVARTSSAQDGRQSRLRLTPAGQRVFRQLDGRQEDEVQQRLQGLSPGQRQQLVSSLRAAQRLLRPENPTGQCYSLRPLFPGDLGWVVHRHGALYFQEEGYDERFEGLVAEIAGEFVKNYDAARERCWIAEKDGEVAGFVFLVKKSLTVCKLRLLLVEPWARGMGIGRRLIAECVKFGREAGYKKMMLWTQSDLLPARRLYKDAGFKLVAEEPHESWGRTGMVSETWALGL